MTSSRDDGSSSSYPPPLLTDSRTYIAEKAREILGTSDITEMENFVRKLCYAKETIEESSKLLLFNRFKEHFPNLLAVKLLQVYRFANLVSPKIRSYSLSLLDSLLIDLADKPDGLKTQSLGVIKEHLNFCLLVQETSDHDFKLLSRIISHVAVDFFIEYIPWDELCCYILSLQDLKKTLLLFSELPSVLDDEFLMPLLEDDLDVKIVRGLSNPDCEEEWCLALEAGFGLMLQLINQQRKDLVWNLVYAIVNSVWEMVNVREREIVVRKGFIRLARKLRREALRFRNPENEVVSRLAMMMMNVDGVGEDTKMAAKTIHEVLIRYYI